jgi:hypothetical protein
MNFTSFKAGVVKPFLPKKFPPNGIRSDVQGFFFPGHGKHVTIHQLHKLNESYDGALNIENINGIPLISHFTAFRKSGQSEMVAQKLAERMRTFLGLSYDNVTVI